MKTFVYMDRKFYKQSIPIFDMVSIAKCVVCDIEFQDTHPSREGNKFCCRDHFKEYKKINGCGNKGKTWEETYSPETLKFMKERISKQGKEHWNYGLKRMDTTLRNLLNNPKRKKEVNDKLKEIFEKNPKRAIKIMLENIGNNKIYAYQRIAYEEYGKLCGKCGQTNGQIDVHHKDMNKKNNKVNNLMVLCASCHATLHKS